MLLFEILAEQKIREAIERGEFARLPGEGKPLDLDDDPLVPEDMRVAYRVLKNAGFLPPELELRNEIRSIEQLMEGMEEGPDRARAMRRLQLLNIKLEESRRGSKPVRMAPEYCHKLMQKLG